MFLKYIGDDQYISLMMGNDTHECAITNIGKMIILCVKYGDTHLGLKYDSLNDILKNWLEV